MKVAVAQGHIFPEFRADSLVFYRMISFIVKLKRREYTADKIEALEQEDVVLRSISILSVCKRVYIF